MSRRSKKSSSKLAATLAEYSKTTTLHGLAYAFEDDQPIFMRSLWAVLVATSLAMAAMLSAQAYSEWVNNMVITTVGSVAIPIERVAFPAITVCAQGMATIGSQEVVEAMLVRKAEELGIPFESEEDFIASMNGLFPGLIERNFTEISSTMTALTLMVNLMRGSPDAILSNRVPFMEFVSPCYLHGSGIVSDLESALEHKTEECSGEGQVRAKVGITGNGPGDMSKVLSGDCLMPVLEPRSTLESCQGPQFNLLEVILKYLPMSETDSFLRVHGSWLRKFQGFFWTGAEYKEGKWLFPRSDTQMHYLKYLKRADNSPDEKEVTYRPCMKVQLDPQEDLFWFTVDDCDKGMAPSICLRRECPSSLKDIMRSHNSEFATGAKYSGYDLVKNTELSAMVEEGKATVEASMKLLARKMLKADVKSSMMELMWSNNLPCYDKGTRTYFSGGLNFPVLRRCEWKGKEVPCHAIFTTVPTDSGMCCAFNTRGAESTFKDSDYLRSITSLRNADYLAAKEYHKTLNPDKDSGTSLDMRTQSGKEKGLTIYVDANDDSVTDGTISTESTGFMAFVGSQDDYPWVRQRGFHIEPGKETSVALRATMVSASKGDIGHISPERRECFFTDESPLEAHQNYSMANCIYECSARMAMDLLAKELNTSACLPWYFVQLDDSVPFCDPWTAELFEELIGDLSPDEECAHCLPDCQITTYETSMSSSNFRICNQKNMGMTQMCSFKTTLDPPKWSSRLTSMYLNPNEEDTPEYVRKLHGSMRFTEDTIFSFYGDEEEDDWTSDSADQDPALYDAYDRDIAKVNFFFDAPTAAEYKRQASLTTVGFTSQVGGLAGLFVGFSFVSLFELAYWFTYRLGRNYISKEKEEEREKKRKNVNVPY